MHKFFALCLAAAGLAAVPFTSTNAHGAPTPAVVLVGVTALPSVARVNETVVIERHRTHRRSRIVRTVRYRHGRRIVTTRRVYY